MADGSVDHVDSTLRLAQFAVGQRLDKVPEAVRSVFKALLLDNVGVMLAGVVQPVYRSVAAATQAASGTGDSEAIDGTSVPFSSAVLLDGLAAAGFEFEQVMQNAHPSSACFPALLALATKHRASGAEFFAAMIVAYELAARIGAACGPAVEHERGFHNPGLNGTLASAAGCARLLGLDARICASAMGIAASSAAGLLAFAETGAMTKRLHPARSAQLGLESALMAQAGVEGPRTVLESAHGFLRAFSPKPNPSALCRNLGEVWSGSKMIIKLSPVHAYALVFVQALNDARDRGVHWSAEELVSVVVEAGPAPMNPRHMDTDPTSLVGVQYSVPYSIATAIARDLRNPLLLDDSVINDPQVRAVIGKLSFKQISQDPRQLDGTVTIITQGGSLRFDAAAYPGLPGLPGYTAAIEGKFDRILAALGIEEHATRLREAVSGAETSAEISGLRNALLAAGKDAARRTA